MEGNDLTELTQDSFKQRVEEACIIVENAVSMCEWQYVSKPDIVVYTLRVHATVLVHNLANRNYALELMWD